MILYYTLNQLHRSYILEMKYIESKRSNRKYEYLYNVL